MHDMADPIVMGKYGTFIKPLAIKYKRRCWPVIYQADCRMRRERIGHILRECTELVERATKAEASGGRCFVPVDPFLFEPSRPWNRVFQLAIKDTEF